ncbi:MAG TPA: hypothetical protein VF710_09425 [Longimicrobium sp.]|jgi:hypothetical protein
MGAEMGEFLVGAFLKIVEKCDFISYNVRPPGGGLKGLEELDVVGLQFASRTAFLCEVTTHIGGLLYGDRVSTVQHIASKHLRQKTYAETQLRDFPNRRYQFWSPVVPNGYLTKHLAEIDPDLELVINAEYKTRIHTLQQEARKRKNDENNPAFRLLQILAHMRD